MELLDFFPPEVEKYVQQMGGLQQKTWFDPYIVAKNFHDTLAQNCDKVVDVCINICSLCLSTRLKGAVGFATMNANQDAIGLISLIHVIY